MTRDKLMSLPVGAAVVSRRRPGGGDAAAVVEDLGLGCPVVCVASYNDA